MLQTRKNDRKQRLSQLLSTNGICRRRRRRRHIFAASNDRKK